MNWLLLLSASWSHALSIVEPKAAIRNTGDSGELDYTPLSSGLAIGPEQSLEIRFRFDGEEAPSQAFVAIKGPSGKHHTVPAKIRRANARVIVPFSSLEAGVSEARAYVASSEGKDISEPLQLKVEASQKKNTISKFDATNQIHFDPQPEIIHQFRPPPRHVSAVVALVFAAAVWGLFLGFVVTLQSQVGLAISAAPFVGSLAAIEAVFVGYYLKLSIFSALFYTAIAGGAALVLGQRALKTLPDVKPLVVEPVSPSEKVVKADAKVNTENKEKKSKKNK